MKMYTTICNDFIILQKKTLILQCGVVENKDAKNRAQKIFSGLAHFEKTFRGLVWHHHS